MLLVSQSASPPRGCARGPWEPRAALPRLLTSGGHATSLLRPFLQLLSEGPTALSPSLRRPWRGGCDFHPPICLAASPATQTPVSRVSPEPCLLHPLHVVSVWAGAGGRAWLHLGGRLGPGFGTGPQPQGTIRWGNGWDQRGWPPPQAERGLQSRGTEVPGQRPRKGRPPRRRPMPQLLTPSPTPQGQSEPGLLPEPRIPCPPALGSLSLHQMYTLGPKPPKMDPALLGTPWSQVGWRLPRATTALGPAASLQFRGGFGLQPRGSGITPQGLTLQGGSGICSPSPSSPVHGKRSRSQDTDRAWHRAI